MRKGLRKAGVACGTAFASVAIALSTATPGLATPSGLVVGGLATPTMHDLVMAQILKDELHGMERVSIYWPAEAKPYSGDTYTLGESIAIGITNLNTEIDTAIGKLAPGEQVKIVGLSAGSLVVTEVLRLLAADPDAPAADQLTFIVVADSSRQKLIDKARHNSRYDYTYQPPPETKYDVKEVTGEYDGMADFPDRWWNFVAVANAMAGGIFVHIPMMFADLKDEYITEIDVNELGGTTTKYLIPTAKLPLVQLLPFLAPMEAELKEMVDRGYSRNDIVETSALRTLTAAVEETDYAAEVTAPAEESVEVDDADLKTEAKGDDGEDLGAVGEDADTGSSTGDDEAEVIDEADEVDEPDAIDEAVEDADEADSVDAGQGDEDAAESEDSTDTDDSDSSGDAASDGTGSSKSGSSE